jgi:hypothetical protein
VKFVLALSKSAYPRLLACSGVRKSAIGAVLTRLLFLKNVSCSTFAGVSRESRPKLFGRNSGFVGCYSLNG